MLAELSGDLSYDICAFVSDSTHLVRDHSADLEQICARLGVFDPRSKCDISSCVLMQRNYRERGREHATQRVLHALYGTDNDK